MSSGCRFWTCLCIRDGRSSSTSSHIQSSGITSFPSGSLGLWDIVPAYQELFPITSLAFSPPTMSRSFSRSSTSAIDLIARLQAYTALAKPSWLTAICNPCSCVIHLLFERLTLTVNVKWCASLCQQVCKCRKSFPQLGMLLAQKF